MARKAAGLTAAKVQDGDRRALWRRQWPVSLVRSAKARFWLFRYTRAGRMREMGLGRAGSDERREAGRARARAAELHKQVRAGVDPLAQARGRRGSGGGRGTERGGKRPSRSGPWPSII